MIRIKHRGSFKNINRFFKRIKHGDIFKVLERHARDGVNALSSATPMDTGETAGAWDYRITINERQAKIEWTNSKMAGRVPVAILIQYGHATRGGTFVQGRDYINPTMEPIFKNIADNVWEEVVSL